MQLCAQNKGRSAAAALTKVVAAAIAAFDAGYSMERLRLELEYTSQVANLYIQVLHWAFESAWLYMFEHPQHPRIPKIFTR